MKDIREFYILGIPVETNIGKCNFLKVKEYPDFFMDLQIISLTKNHLINKYRELNKLENNSEIQQLIEEMEKVSLYTLVTSLADLRESYVRLFAKVFGYEDAFLDVIEREEDFEYYRHLIMEMNSIKEEKINPNPEIQKAIERSKRVKSADGNRLEFSDIVTSCVGYNGLSYNDINDFTIYQLYSTFYRIAQIKNYDTSTLFATVATKVEIDSWSKHIDLFEDSNHAISKEEFEKSGNSLFGGKK